MARTLMARLPSLTRTRSFVTMVKFFYAVILIFYFNDRRSLKIENENNNTKTLTAEVSYKGLGSLEFRFI